MLTAPTQTRGSVPGIIRNVAELYEGNLVKYFQIVFKQAQNLKHPYHNFRHMLHVVWQCHRACEFYKDTLTPRQMRNLLVAAHFHDFDHSALYGEDQLNIKRAILGFKFHILTEDVDSVEDIVFIIKATECPYAILPDDLNLEGKIIRDADLSQAFSVAWVQQVVFGLAAEWRKEPIEVLRMQKKFHLNLRFHTEWAQGAFPQSEIDGKIAEAEELLAVLEMEVV